MQKLKSQIINLSTELQPSAIIQLYDNIVSPSTIYKWIRESQTLDYSYTNEETEREWNRIISSEGLLDSPATHNKIILTHQPHFYHREKELYKDVFIKNKLLDNRKKYLNKSKFTDRELLRGFKISGIHYGYSHFSPLWVKWFIHHYNIKSLYDPCGGWGHRLLGSHNISYIYNDIWELSCKGCENIIQHFGIENKTIYNNDCTTFTPIEKYDAVFTCPPYFNLELYNQPSFKDIHEYELFVFNMVNASFVKSGAMIMGIVINTPLIYIIENVCMKLNLYISEKFYVGIKSRRSHFYRNIKDDNRELLLSITKGDI